MPMMKVLRVVTLLALLSLTGAFSPSTVVVHHMRSSTTSISASKATTTAYSPRTGVLQSLLNLALDSPLWTYVLVPQARQKMVDTAASNGISWIECREWIERSGSSSNNKDWSSSSSTAPEAPDVDISHVPVYYQQPFHAYEKGNLCWEAAFEAEIASAAVGARNFPDYGRKGEAAFRGSFQACLDELGASIIPVQKDATIVDLGCGTGMSTRSLAQKYPEVSHILGLDMSPYFCAVGRRLLELAPTALDDGGKWVSTIHADDRIEYRVAAAEATGLADNSIDVVNLQFVAHELPGDVTIEILREAHRILKPSGQLWFCEMDFDTPAYAAQRANPLLFSLIRATEPYLDDYADHAQDIRDELKRLFVQTKIGAATGRHFAMVATKGAFPASAEEEHVLEDYRWDAEGNYVVEDTHLKVWENKS